jgi:hypothetical protein
MDAVWVKKVFFFTFWYKIGKKSMPKLPNIYDDFAVLFWGRGSKISENVLT